MGEEYEDGEEYVESSEDDDEGMDMKAAAMGKRDGRGL